jgi:hypothetical protein
VVSPVHQPSRCLRATKSGFPDRRRRGDRDHVIVIFHRFEVEKEGRESQYAKRCRRKDRALEAVSRRLNRTPFLRTRSWLG